VVTYIVFLVVCPQMELILRQRQEAEVLHAVQKLDWEWKLKEMGVCDNHSTPNIDEVNVPFVIVTDDLTPNPT